MTTLEVDREMGDIIERRVTGQERQEEAARLAYLQAWRRHSLFPGRADGILNRIRRGVRTSPDRFRP